MLYTPTLEQAKATANQGNLLPVYCEINADLETPVTAYLKVAGESYSFLLESVEGGERLARYSFIGTDPSKIITSGPGTPLGSIDPLQEVEKALRSYRPIPVDGLPRFHGGAVGYLSYDTARYFEPRLQNPVENTLGLPEAVFMFTDTLLIFDHLRHRIQVVSNVDLTSDIPKAYQAAISRIERMVERLRAPLQYSDGYSLDLMHTLPTSQSHTPSYTSNFTKDAYYEMVDRIRRYIIDGDIIQAVSSQRLAVPTEASPINLYRALRTINPSPYMYLLSLDGFHIIGASPEMLVRLDNRVIETHPIAGTRRRGVTADEDDSLATELSQNDKERAEHIMLVDLGRNDVGRVSEPGTVKVTQFMDIERYSHVMHLVSHVQGNLRPELTAFDALRSCFPAGTLSGAPKIRAMEIIQELERDARGPYGGAVGYFSYSGNMDTAITIRTMVLKDKIAYVQAGGGIVYDSTPEREHQETLEKASAVLRAIGLAENRKI